MWTLKYFMLALCFSYELKISDSKYAENTVDAEDRIIYKKYMEMDKLLKTLLSSGTKMMLPYLMEASEHMNLSSTCMGNFLQLTTGIRKLKLSAMKFLDATGKPPEGYLNGNMHMLGDYDQCLSTTVQHRSGLIAFKGQYCLIHYTPLLPKQKRPVTFDGGIEELVEATRNTSEVVQFIVSKAQLFYYNPSKLGVCVPSGCSENDMQQVVHYLADKMYFSAKVAYCDMDDEVFVNTKNTVFICLFVLVGVLVVIGTAVEYLSWKIDINLKSYIIKGLMCFSILTNFPKAISTETPSENSIPCLHGIRALTLFYIILLHQYYAVVKYFITTHVSRALDEIPQFFMQIVTNGFLTADVFFFIGGLVNCYSRVKMNDKERRKTNFLLQMNHRIWRIGPAYLFFCCMMSLYRPYGPMRMYEKKEYVDKCDKFWWQNALFINNFFLQDDTCSPHSWYLAADMQLFVVSLFTIPVLLRSPKKGIIVNSAMVFIGVFFSIIWSWATNLTPGLVFYRPNKEEINKAWNANTYTFCHIASYFSGILMGYYLAVKKDVTIPKLYQVIGWPIAVLIFMSMLFMTKVWNSGGDFSNADSSLYYGFSKFLFVLPIGWMILCCISGNGGVINYILCLPFWIPISKISFVVYLIAPFMQTFYFANSRTVVDGHRMPLIWRYFGDAAISCILGLVIVVLVESPFKRMEKLLFGRWQYKQDESDKQVEAVSNGTIDVKLKNKTELDYEKNLPHICK